MMFVPSSIDANTPTPAATAAGTGAGVEAGAFSSLPRASDEIRKISEPHISHTSSSALFSKVQAVQVMVLVSWVIEDGESFTLSNSR